MWQDSRDRDHEVALSQLNLNDFFKLISKQTLFSIIYERSVLVRFRPGELVLPIHSRSPWNVQVFKMYQSAQETIFELDHNKMNVTGNQLNEMKRQKLQDYQKH